MESARRGTIFIAGAYGTGKSTLAEKISEAMYTPFYSAGDLISEVNGEMYGANKVVSNKDANQIILSQRVSELSKEHRSIILVGHFCIFGAASNVEVLPDSVFAKLNLSQIILIEADVSLIIKHLTLRDGAEYELAAIEKLVECERQQASKISNEIDCPLHIHKMSFSDNDLTEVMSYIIGSK